MLWVLEPHAHPGQRTLGQGGELLPNGVSLYSGRLVTSKGHALKIIFMAEEVR
jgi:hypothetical protein